MIRSDGRKRQSLRKYCGIGFLTFVVTQYIMLTFLETKIVPEPLYQVRRRTKTSILEKLRPGLSEQHLNIIQQLVESREGNLESVKRNRITNQHENNLPRYNALQKKVSRKPKRHHFRSAKQGKQSDIVDRTAPTDSNHHVSTIVSATKNDAVHRKTNKMGKHIHIGDSGTPDTTDLLLGPIFRAGKMYSIGRKDRSGSVLADMLYAHAFAFAHNITYAGACFTVKGLPKDDTLHLLQELQWNKILPFACPPGVDSSLNIFKPNATALSPLILNDDLYRWNVKADYFTLKWRQSIQNSIWQTSESTIDEQGSPPYEIVVHVRRGDVSPCQNKRRYLTNNHYLQLIDQYTPSREERNHRPLHVTIFTESDSFEDMTVFRERNYSVELDTEDLAVIWKAFLSADVLILSRSYFSFVPAAVNPNIVVATEFFGFEPLPGWKKADSNLVKQTDQEIRHMAKKYCSGGDAIQNQ